MTREFNSKAVQEVSYNFANGSISLDLPPTSEEELPCVSVLTITKNRRKLFPIAIYNWKNFKYPENKLEWIIVDDGEEDLTDILPIDNRIKYIKTSPMNIGDKRNFAVESAKYDYLVHVDDDDFHFSDSILAKARVMKKYNKKGCLYCHTLGSYSIQDHSSAILEKYKDIPEATMMFTRKFWEKRKFGKVSPGISEAYNLCKKQEGEMIKMSFWFSCIAMSHTSNYTHNLRSIPDKVKDGCPSFYDIVFDEEFKKILDGLH